MKIGDRVRFLNATGGGKITAIEKNNIVLVEDEDGFDIPTKITDVVVVDDDDYSTSRMVEHTKPAQKEEKIEPEEPADKEVTFRMPAEERKGGNLLSAYLAFIATDEKDKFEAYFINDSNYYLQYSYLAAEGNNWNLRSNGEVEPNTTVFIEEVDRTSADDFKHVGMQLLAYKKDKSFIIKPTVDVQFRIDTVKFYKPHTFIQNDFFDESALIYPIIENDVPIRQLVVDAKQLKEEMYKKEDTYTTRYEKKGGNPFIIKHKGDKDIVVTDLHAHEILETTAGMSAGDILNYQLDVFRKTLADNKPGQKIIVIHGKGNGILRNKIINELNHKYKNYTYQDASFQEYGYGATQITIK